MTMLKIHANLIVEVKMKYITLILTGLFFIPVSASAQFLFQDVTTQAGIYMFGNGSNEAGSGVVVADFNNDGWDDCYFAGGEDFDKIFLNMHDGTFKDITPLNVKTLFDRNGLQWRTNP